MHKKKESNQLTSIDSKSLQNRLWKDNDSQKTPLTFHSVTVKIISPPMYGSTNW